MANCRCRRQGFTFEIVLFLLLILLAAPSMMSYKFKLHSTGDHLMNWETIDFTRSAVECGSLCAQRRLDNGIEPMCESYNYNTLDGRCQLYIARPGSTDAYGVSVYTYFVDEDPNDDFDLITWGGQTFIYHMIRDRVTYDIARDRCQSRGAYPVNFDSMEEFNVFVTYVLNKQPGVPGGLWVGAQDIENEGQWVTDRHKLPLDFSVWKFNPHEPSNDGYGEDCANYWVYKKALNDVPCNVLDGVVCERTP